MEAVTENLIYLIGKVPEKIKGFNEEELSKRPAQNKWSVKEIIGHLCDSAVNNLQRFVRIQFESQPFVVTGYDQQKWVSVQNYQDMSASDIIELWVCLNKQIVRVINALPKEKCLYLCRIEGGQDITLEALIQDYLDHMKHHLEQIFQTGI